MYLVNSKFASVLGCILWLMIGACKQKHDEWKNIQLRLTPLHKLKGQPMPGEWLAEHKETYQSFETYVKQNPTRFGHIRNKIYIVRIGKFSLQELQIVSKTARYLWLFYGLQVKYMDLPKEADFLKDSRKRAETGIQLSASLILHQVLALIYLQMLLYLLHSLHMICIHVRTGTTYLDWLR